MNEKVAQATVAPNSGASSTKDFQPDTGNPQKAPVNLFQQQGGIQNITNTQELLSDQQNAKIIVTSEPASAPRPVAQVKETPTGFILALVVAIVVLLIFIFKKLRSNAYETSADRSLIETNQSQASQEIVAVKKPETAEPKAKSKTAQKRKASKKAKRRRK